ncbi:MAG: nucleotidyltransferase family protein [Pseudomonadales bacterium]
MNVPPTDLKDELCQIVNASAWFQRALRAARELGLPSWCIGAGAVRNLVWDHLHGYAEPSSLADVDLAYFDSTEVAGEERVHQLRIEQYCSDFPWEVTNQAHVHLWYEHHFGHAVAPLRSLHEAVASWPEFATCVGVTQDADGRVQVISPHGLDDLFSMKVRRNPVRVSIDTFRRRTETKRYAQRWPLVTIVEGGYAA